MPLRGGCNRLTTSRRQTSSDSHSGAINGNSSVLLTDWNSMMKELFRAADGTLVDQTQDSISSGIASDDPYYPTSPSTFSEKSSPVRSRQSAVDSGLEFIGPHRRSRCPSDEVPNRSAYRPSNQSSRNQQQPICYQYRHSDMTSYNGLHSAAACHQQHATRSSADAYNNSWSKDVSQLSATCNNGAYADVRRNTPITCTTPVAHESPRQNTTPVPYNTGNTPVISASPRLSITPVQQYTCSPPVLQSSYGHIGAPVIKSTCSTPVTYGRPSHCSTPAPWREDSDKLRCADTAQSSGILQKNHGLRPSRRGATCCNGTPYIDILTDETLTAVFLSGLNSLDLCRCAAVCRRWNKLVWNPILWTSIDIRDLPQIDADQALRCLTRILSRDTPTVCITIVKVVLSGCHRLSDQGLLTIAKRCTELNRLEVAGCRRLTNVAVFEVVSRCVSLVHLDVTGCDQVTCISLTPEANMAAVTYGHQVYLRLLDMSECIRLDDAGLQLVASYCPALVKLYVRRCPLITDRGVQYVAAYCVSLRELSVAECHQVTDFGVGELASRRESSLRYISVARCSDHVTDAALMMLGRHCHRLRYLNVRGCVGITNSGLTALSSGCHRLKSLDIGECDNVTDSGLVTLAEGCRSLRRLSVRGCVRLTDSGVGSLARLCHKLEQLNIQNCPGVSKISLEIIRRNCPRCVIEHNNFAFY